MRLKALFDRTGQTALIGLAVPSLLAVLPLRRLAPDAGSELSGHRPA